MSWVPDLAALGWESLGQARCRIRQRSGRIPFGVSRVPDPAALGQDPLRDDPRCWVPSPSWPQTSPSLT